MAKYVTMTLVAALLMWTAATVNGDMSSGPDGGGDSAVLPVGGTGDSSSFDDYIPGDTNRDGNVDLDDFSIFSLGFNTPIGATWEQGDFDIDGDVDMDDFAYLQNNFGASSGQQGGDDDERQEPAIPAPSALILAAIGLGLVVPLKRRLAASQQ